MTPETASPLPTTAVTPSATATATASATATATPVSAPSATVAAVTPSPPPTLSITPPPASTPSLDSECDEVLLDPDGTVFVNGQAVEDPWSAEYGEQMPMAVLRLAARASAGSDAEVCIEVELPDVLVTGVVEVCGGVVAARLAPMETPPPLEPGPTMPPTYGLPAIDGVEIPDRLLDVNSYPLLDIADVEDVTVCFHVQADANDVWVTLSLAICPSAHLGSDGTLTIFVGDQEWIFAPDYVYDDTEALPIGETVAVGLDIRNYKDDVIHLVEMGVWVAPGCPWQDR